MIALALFIEVQTAMEASMAHTSEEAAQATVKRKGSLTMTRQSTVRVAILAEEPEEEPVESGGGGGGGGTLHFKFAARLKMRASKIRKR